MAGSARGECEREGEGGGGESRESGQVGGRRIGEGREGF